MFGYIKPDYPNLYMKDNTLYKALYCGMCKSIGKKSGELARFSLTYDITFLSAIIHVINGEDVQIKKSRCITHFIKSIPIAVPDEISYKLADVNVLLAYYKTKDDIIDNKKGYFKNSILKKGFRKSKKRSPEIDQIINDSYNNLRVLEKNNNESVDMVSDSFAQMLEKISKLLLKEQSNEYTEKLFYSLGKWVYLIDALDDYDKDIKNNNYNVFYLSYKAKDYKELLEKHRNEIAFIFNAVFMIIMDCAKNIKYKFNSDLVLNILLKGLPMTTQKILDKGNKK